MLQMVGEKVASVMDRTRKVSLNPQRVLYRPRDCERTDIRGDPTLPTTSAKQQWHGAENFLRAGIPEKYRRKHKPTGTGYTKN